MTGMDCMKVQSICGFLKSHIVLSLSLICESPPKEDVLLYSVFLVCYD